MVDMAEDSSVVWTKVDPQGRVVIPAELRSQFGMEPGKAVAFLVEDGQLKLLTVNQGIHHAQNLVARYFKKVPGHSYVDEFIAERRAEAERE